MLTLDISAGNYIGTVCDRAAKLARHPLARLHDDGAWYALDRGTMLRVHGPWRKPEGVAERYDGSAYWDVCDGLGFRQALRVQANSTDPGVRFTFNDITVECEAIDEDDPRTVGDIAQALHEQWEAKCQAAYEAYWTPERKAQAAREQAEHAAKMARRRDVIATALTKHPFQPTDPDAYAEYKRVNADGYGGAVVRYGEAWAAMMECFIDTGSTVAYAAKITQDEADCEGITGFQYGCAVRQLVTWWKHGEALREWHNAEYGHDGSGVVNPAVMTLSSKD